jgi:hypothetical protein
MKKTSKTGKLSLHKESIRHLQQAELREVAAGHPPPTVGPKFCRPTEATVCGLCIETILC